MSALRQQPSVDEHTRIFGRIDWDSSARLQAPLTNKSAARAVHHTETKTITKEFYPTGNQRCESFIKTLLYNSAPGNIWSVSSSTGIFVYHTVCLETQQLDSVLIDSPQTPSGLHWRPLTLPETVKIHSQLHTWRFNVKCSHSRRPSLSQNGVFTWTLCSFWFSSLGADVKMFSSVL